MEPEMEKRRSSSSSPSPHSPLPSPSSSSPRASRHATSLSRLRNPPSAGYHRHLVVTATLALLLLAVVDSMVIPEERTLSQSRLRRHQRNRTLVYHVRNREDALLYLQKYGYLEHCTVLSRQKRKELKSVTSSPSLSTTTMTLSSLAAMTSSLPVEEGGDFRPRYCTAKEQREAIKSLQETFHLPQTGRLDAKTKKLMEIRRCGNADILDPDQSLKRRRKRSLVATGADDNFREGGQSTLNSTNVTGESGVATERVDLTALVESEPPPKLAPVIRAGLPYEHLSIPEVRINKSREEIVLARLRNVMASLNNQSSNGGEEPEVDESEALASLERRRSGRSQRRKKRSVAEQKVLPERNGSSIIRWRLLRGESETLTFNDQKAAIIVAFRMWSECVPVKFLEVPHVDVRITDTFVTFAKRNHMNCEKPFDGFGGELAHSWALGDIHFDGDEHFKKLNQYTGGIDMLRVAIHEVGHVLGLQHTEERNSIMFPLYIHVDYDYDYEIPEVDRRAVQRTFGVCKGTFDAVFDWVHLVDGDRVFTSFFLRGSRYWRYSNREKRPISDDDTEIAARWPDLPPSGIDSFLQINNTETAYVFSGDSCYKMDNTGSYVVTGYPRKISEEFPTKAGVESVPGDLDASFFYWTTVLYLLKGEWVWICNPDRIGQPDCCHARSKFTDVFTVKVNPNLSPDEAEGEVSGNVSSVFFSHANHVHYLLKDTLYYEMRASEGGDPAEPKFVLYPRGRLWQKWLDICDPAS